MVETLSEQPNRRHALTAPGQGNQETGMGFALTERSDYAKAVWNQSDLALYTYKGYNFSELVWQGTVNGVAFDEDPEQAKIKASAELTKTENAQPAIIIDALARRAALEEFDFLDNPYWYAGNSLGFIVALCTVGSLSIPSAVQLGIGRGEAFKYAIEHSPRTTMLALVEVDPAITKETRQRFELEISLINTDTQIVLGGPVENIKNAVEYLNSEKGLKRGVVSLEGDVDAAFHSKYMAAAVPLYRKVVNDIQIEAPAKGVLIGASGRAKQLHTVDDIRRELISQLTRTENWRAAVYYLRRRGVNVMTELNSVPRLTNMNISMFDRKNRTQRLATPSVGEKDRGVTIAQRWQASWLKKAAA